MVQSIETNNQLPCKTVSAPCFIYQGMQQQPGAGGAPCELLARDCRMYILFQRDVTTLDLGPASLPQHAAGVTLGSSPPPLSVALQLLPVLQYCAQQSVTAPTIQLVLLSPSNHQRSQPMKGAQVRQAARPSQQKQGKRELTKSCCGLLQANS